MKTIKEQNCTKSKNKLTILEVVSNPNKNAKSIEPDNITDFVYNSSESNLDSIINQAQIKMKEMILEKQSYHKKKNLLIGQERVLEENINSLKSEIDEKNRIINDKAKELLELEEELKHLDEEKKEELRKANIKEAKLKDDINNINEELERIKDGTIPAQAAKMFELKKNCEEVENLKNQNNQLRERLYILSRRLYTLEVRNYFLII